MFLYKCTYICLYFFTYLFISAYGYPVVWALLTKMIILSQCPSWHLSVLFSCSVVSDSLWPHELQHARPPCLSPVPRVKTNSCPLSHLILCQYWSFSFSISPSNEHPGLSSFRMDRLDLLADNNRMDRWLAHSTDFTGSQMDTIKTLNVLYEKGYWVSPKKAQISLTQVRYCGFIITKGKRMFDPQTLILDTTYPNKETA